MSESISKVSRASKARVHEIVIVDNFKLSYRNREDITNTSPGVLVVGSQDVLVNTSSRVQIRQGYTLDGTLSTSLAPINSSFEWNTKGNGARYMRAGFLTSVASSGKMQFRYASGTTITWTDLLTSLTSTNFNFTTFWDTTELLRVVLFVDGTTTVREWNGAYGTVASTSASAINLNQNVGTSGFYTTRNKVVTVDGVDYTYTTATGSSFGGITPTPSSGINPGDLVFQKVVATSSASFAGSSASGTTIDLISVLNNQVFIGSLTSPIGYMSKINNYKDYTFSATRLPGEGATFTLDDNIVGFIPQEENMYISAGKNFWYNTTLTQSTVYNGSTGLTTELFKVNLLKVNNQQGAQSQALINKAGNKIIMVTYEPTFDELGRVEDIIAAPNVVNLSDPIKLDFDEYDFTGGSVYSWKTYKLVTIPTLGIVRIFNEFTRAWEAPQNLPVTSFYTVDGELYGHSSITSESYHLFDGYSDRATPTVKGQPIQAIVNFAYQNFGTRTALKNANEFYMEGYINKNTSLTGEINYELDGCLSTQSFTVNGTDPIVCLPLDEASLGKEPLGKIKLGGDTMSSLTGLPPKFRVIKTFNRYNFYECQFSFSILGIDQRFELLAFGINAAPADDTNALIKDGSTAIFDAA